jgi:phage terminase large subunit-like protein
MSADLPAKYWVNSMAKENSARERAVFQKLRILGNAIGIIKPSGTNITTFAAVWATFFGSGIPQVS